jgi:AcrR family transcriptional regulator
MGVSYDCMVAHVLTDEKPIPTRRTITEAVLRIGAEQGVEHVSIRVVAAAAGVSIGTVQHHFPTKDALLQAAYVEVLDRIAARIETVALGEDPRLILTAVLAELLPLDRERAWETRVHLAFAARAATSPPLADTQRAALSRLRTGLAASFARATGAPSERCELAAHVAIAVADGLALHAVSAEGWLSEPVQRAALKLALDALVATLTGDRPG